MYDSLNKSLTKQHLHYHLEPYTTTNAIYIIWLMVKFAFPLLAT